MDQELKQRLIGAAVVTALAAIFVPMLFDDPVDESGQMVSELTIPKSPAASSEDTANKLPASTAEVTAGEPAMESTESVDGLKKQSADLPLQPSEKIEQDEAIIEETGQPIDEQQWIEESADEEESGRVTEDTGNDDLESQTPAADDDSAAPLSAKPANRKTDPVASPPLEITEEPRRPVKTETPETGSVKSPIPKTPSEPAPAMTKKPKADESNSKARLVRWYLQAGSFGKKENALSRQEALRKQGLPVFLETQTTDKGTFYRLKIGPELDKKRAIVIRDRLNKQNVKTIILAE